MLNFNEVKIMTNEKKHPTYEIPNDPHGKHRHESAMKHAEFAKQAGKSSEEIHEIFHKVMNFDPRNIEGIPTDEAHKQYRSAMIHAQKAVENGKNSEEAHQIFKSILAGDGQGKSHH